MQWAVDRDLKTIAEGGIRTESVLVVFDRTGASAADRVRGAGIRDRTVPGQDVKRSRWGSHRLSIRRLSRRR